MTFSGRDFEAIVDSAVSPYSIVGDDGTIRWTSSSITELTGWRPDEVVGRNMLDFLDEASQAAVIDAFSRFLAVSSEGEGWLGSGLLLTIRTADGGDVDVIASATTSIRTGIDGLVVQMVRASTQRRLYSAISAMASGAELTDVVRHLADMVASEIAGARVEIAWGWDGERFTGVGGDAGLLVLDDGTGERPWADAVATGAPHATEHVDGMPAPVVARAHELGVVGCWVHPITVVGGEPPTAAVVVWRTRAVDATSFTTQYVERGVDLVALALQWHRGKVSLEEDATHDTLTGLANRRALLTRLQDAAEGSVLFCDLDRFKPVNDEHGHAVGDRALVAVADRLQGAVRPTDLVARYGGDEFVVFCPGLVRDAERQRLLGRLRDAVALPIELDDAVVTLGVSIGVAAFGPGDDPRRAIEAAADAMRRVKRRSEP